MKPNPERQSSANAVATQRSTAMLSTAMGPIITEALDDADVIEVMLNPDGTLWVDRLSTGRSDTGYTLNAIDGERIVRLVAAHVRGEVHNQAPILSAELPDSGARFEGLLPPVVQAPCFAIRKRALGVIPLIAYVANGILAQRDADFLVRAVRERRNIIIAGATSSGKTTLANALLQEIATTGDRVVILEDTIELQCDAADHVALRTLRGIVSMADLVRSTLRLRPDRIVIGEVRGAEALDLLKAWGTGHPGGIATLHASSALGVLSRLEQLILEVAATVPRALIAEAVDVIVFIGGRGKARRIKEIVGIESVDADGYHLHDFTTERNPS